MRLDGGCYCGEVRYRAEGEPMVRGECYCRECQYISGGQANIVMGMPAATFTITQGEPKEFRRSDLDKPVSRAFCGTCGTHLFSRPQVMPDVLMLKVGTLDDPGQFGGPQMVIYTCDKQAFHQLPKDVPTFEKLPPM